MGVIGSVLEEGPHRPTASPHCTSVSAEHHANVKFNSCRQWECGRRCSSQVQWRAKRIWYVFFFLFAPGLLLTVGIVGNLEIMQGNGTSLLGTSNVSGSIISRDGDKLSDPLQTGDSNEEGTAGWLARTVWQMLIHAL